MNKNPDAAHEDAPVTPIVIASDTTTSPVADSTDATTTAARHEAYHAVHQWQGKPLHGFAFQRESLFKIARRFLPLGYMKLPEEYHEDYDAEVALLLFLCASTPAEIEAIRHSADLIINKAFEWADANMPRAHRADAGALAFLILRQAEINTAVPRPDGKEVKVGN